MGILFPEMLTDEMFPEMLADEIAIDKMVADKL